MANSLPNAPEFPDPSRLWITIIGMGAGGARAFTSLMDATRTNTRLSRSVGFILVDKNPITEFGKGIAWSSSQSALFLANMRLPTMGLPSYVIALLKERLGVNRLNQTLLPEDFQFQVRRIIGDALHMDFLRQLDLARDADIPVLIRAEHAAQDISRLGRGFVVDFGGTSGQIFSDYVILALGNVPANKYPQFAGIPSFITNPWSWDNYGDSLSGKRVGIIGLGPTAVDTMLFAKEKGAASVVAASPSGRLQYPRPKNSSDEDVESVEDFTPYVAKHLSTERVKRFCELKSATGLGKLTYSDLLSKILSEFDEVKAYEQLCSVRKDSVTKSPRDMLISGMEGADKFSQWYSVLKSIDEHTPYIWHCLDDEARVKYSKYLEKDHNAISYGMAYLQAKRLVQFIDDRFLSIGRLTNEDKSIVYSEETGIFSMHVNEKLCDVDTLISCSGIGGNLKDFSTYSHSLIHHLHSKSWLVPHKDGGFCVDFNSGRLLSSVDGPPSAGRIYSLTGSMTRGTHLLTNCLWQLFTSCDRTAQEILVSVGRNTPQAD